MNSHGIMREIGIDAGHRIPNHGSKCRSVHGHRYTIQAYCKGPLEPEGSSEGMVLDFGFLKEEMMSEIDTPCDHGLIMWWHDRFTPWLMGLDHGEGASTFRAMDKTKPQNVNGLLGKLYLVPFVPTAENLARHWFERLAPKVLSRSGHRATLVRVRVGETPNCWASYPEEQ